MHKAVGIISLYTSENDGVRILSSLLRRKGYRVVEIYFKDWKNNYLDLPIKSEIDNMIGMLKDYNVSLAGMSVRASGFMDIAIDITGKIKEKLNIPVIWGGMHPTSMPQECIKVTDFICMGESEEAFCEFVNNFFEHRNLTGILNIWAKEEGRIYRNKLRPLIKNLDSIPFRDFTSQDKFFINKNSIVKGDPCIDDRIYLISASRGCPYGRCSFCVIPLLSQLYKDDGGYIYRCRSVENVIKELIQAKEIFPKLKRIRFDDEQFITMKKWLKDFSREYKKYVDLPFDILLNPGSVNKENLSLLKKAGLDTAIMGIQNTESVNQRLYERYITDRQVISSAKIIKEVGLKAHYQIVVDDPLSTSKDKEDFLNFILSLPRPFELYLFSLTIYPNTPLAKELIERKDIKYEDQIKISEKIFYQYRVDLNYKRTKEDIFWVSLLVLASKNYIPVNLLKAISKNTFFKKHPFAIKWVAQLTNAAKMVIILSSLLLRREIDKRTIKRWLNFKSIITQ